MHIKVYTFLSRSQSAKVLTFAFHFDAAYVSLATKTFGLYKQPLVFAEVYHQNEENSSDRRIRVTHVGVLDRVR